MRNLTNLFNQSALAEVDSDQHSLTIFAVTHNLRAKNILELGVRDGGTTQPLLDAAVINKGHLTSVDIAQHTFTPFDPVTLANWTFIQQDAIKYLEELVGLGEARPTFDVVLVDDWHDAKHVARELALLDNLVSIKSVILLHDAMYNNSQPLYNTNSQHEFADGGVYTALKGLDQNKWEWMTIPTSHGLTLLRKKVGEKWYEQ